MQINICGLSERSSVCLNQYVNSNHPDIVFLSETNTKSFPKFNNYDLLIKPSKQMKGGVGFLFSRASSFERQAHLEHPDLDAMFCVANIGKLRALLCSVYIPPNNDAKLKQFLVMATKAIGQTSQLRCSGLIILGDLNARHYKWGDHIFNPAENTLSDYLDINNLLPLSNFSGNTFLCQGGGSRIDIALMSPSIAKFVSHQWLDEEIELFSGAPIRGHIPVWHRLSLSRPSFPSTLIPN